MSDKSTSVNPNTRILRSVLIVSALLFLAVAGAVLLRPLEISEVPRWNVLVCGYTVVGLVVAVVAFFMAVALGLISLIATRAKLISRLKNLLVVTVTSLICLIILDVLLPSIMPVVCYDNPVIAHQLGLKGTPFVADEEFGIRYRAGFEADHVINMLRDGDLITSREAVKPASLDEPENGRVIHVKMDRNGFFNGVMPDECDIFVVGGSYVVPPVPYQCFWTSLLKEKTAKTVYNAGTAMYSFQQELMVLRKYGLDKKPKTVIWGYFQGNDLSDAERFDRFQNSGLSWSDYIRKYRGLDNRPFPYNRPTVKMLIKLADKFGAVSADETGVEYQVPCEVVAAGKRKTYVFCRHFMASASHSREDILNSRGWEICRESLLAAKSECDKIGARFVITYFPAKITAMFEQMEHEYDWDVYYRYLCLDKRVQVDSARQAREMLRDNRAAQCELLKEFCEENGIELVDMTQPLQDAAKQGRWPYFSYDTHLNIEGNRIVAEELAKYLGRN